MKKLTRLALVATFALLLRASVQAQNLTPVSSTTSNGIAASQLMLNSETNPQSTSQINSQNAQDKFDKTALRNDKGPSKYLKSTDKNYAPPHYGRNQTVLKH